jgi:Domain of unknown function (DUF4185)
VLSPPEVVVPITACTDTVRLRGQFTGSTVMIAAGPPLQERVVFTGIAQGPDDEFVLPRRLNAGESVRASQSFQGEDSSTIYRAWNVEPEPDASELNPLSPDAHFHACGRCVAIGGGYPGAIVTLESNANGLLGSRTVGANGAARMSLSQPLVNGDLLLTQQSVCGIDGPRRAVPDPDLPRARDWTLSPPKAPGPLVECDRAILIDGIYPGATVRIYRGGAEYASACCDYARIWFRLADGLRAGEQVEIDQQFPGCEYLSPRVPAPSIAPLAELPTPRIVGPICKGMTSIRVTGLRFGARVRLVQTAQDFVMSIGLAEAEAWDETCDIQLTRPVAQAQGQYVMAAQSACGLESQPSRGEKINRRHRPRAPFIVGRVFECGRRVRVGGIEPGARVEMLMSCSQAPGYRRISSTVEQGPTADIAVSPSLARNRTIKVRQITCGLPQESPTVPVEPVGALRGPVVQECGDRILIRDVVPGARVEAYLNGAFLADTLAASDAAAIRVAKGVLSPGGVLQARQMLCASVSPFGPPMTIRSETEKTRFTWISTERISQLTGTPKSIAAGIQGTDLGIVVHHDTGDGRLNFFFGDTAVTDDAEDFPENGDCIGWTFKTDSGQFGPDLDFFHSVEDGNPVPKPFLIDGVAQEEFEVPSGGFSHAGRLFVFATTDHYEDDPITHGLFKDRNFMGRSVLAAAPTPWDTFHVVPDHGDISNRTRESSGGFKFINNAPWKVRNDDWPDLPDNARHGMDGLIIVGSGRYRESQPCLAYVPLSPDREPEFDEWRYLSGFERTDFDLAACGKPKWSRRQEDAIFLFDDSPFALGNKGTVGELSLAFFDEPRQWVLLYGGVAMRSAPFPWGPWTPPVPLFQFGRDHPDPNDPNDPRPRFIDPGGASYGAYLVPRFCRWDELTNQLALDYCMSTWKPYQVMLMRSVVALDCAYREGWSCPAR